jgi:hypothetical protein
MKIRYTPPGHEKTLSWLAGGGDPGPAKLSIAISTDFVLPVPTGLGTLALLGLKGPIERHTHFHAGNCLPALSAYNAPL